MAERLVATIAAPPDGDIMDVVVVEAYAPHIWIMQENEDGGHGMVAFEPSQADAVIAAIQAAKKFLAEREKPLPAGHGARGEPTTVLGDSMHETPGRQPVSPEVLENLLDYIERQSSISRNAHRDDVVAILEGRPWMQ